ncbi:hypothetical protein VN97_g837 [Penicillium thymicola]|uniref:Uncharacterized protein n=1 Tax=Penicillium thymicola TaxID=293382 RepID=A0AAI9TS50_PENTH|nr:hypothetical protein VN97_g837 [Penicillium thymicola]
MLYFSKGDRLISDLNGHVASGLNLLNNGFQALDHVRPVSSAIRVLFVISVHRSPIFDLYFPHFAVHSFDFFSLRVL